jgi:hypothetical protein
MKSEMPCRLGEPVYDLPFKSKKKVHRSCACEAGIYYQKKPLYRGINLRPTIYDDSPITFDPKRLDKVRGFYGYGVYFSLTPRDATIWGQHIAEYTPVRNLKLWKEPKTHKGLSIKRKDYLEKLPVEYDGIFFGSGAEGADQILLRDPSLVKLTKRKVKYI